MGATLIGCTADGSDADRVVDETTSTASSTTTVGTEDTTTSSSPAIPSRILTMRLRHDGLGPVRVGMTLSEIEAALGEPLDLASDDPNASCTQHQPSSAGGIFFVIIDDELSFIHAVGLATDAGVGPGSTEAEVKAAYEGDHIATGRNRLAVRQLAVRPSSGEPLATLFLMSTAGNEDTVETVMVGSYPEVEHYDEGCP
jgi:hypothetical protein